MKHLKSVLFAFIAATSMCISNGAFAHNATDVIRPAKHVGADYIPERVARGLGPGDLLAKRRRRSKPIVPDGFIDLALMQACTDGGLLLVSASGEILARTDRASRLLCDDLGISEREGRIAFSRAHLHRAFLRMFEEAVVPVSGGLERSRSRRFFAIPGPCGKVSLIAKIVLFESDGERRALIVLTSLTTREPVLPAAMAQAFSLSRREAEFACFFAQGVRLAEISPRMGISLNTAKVHLRNIFGKLGCNNQAELARTLAHVG